MSWFWGKKDAQDASNDPYAKLDPSLREFLDKESPLKYEDTKPISKPSPSSTTPPSSGTYRAQLGLDASSPLDVNNQTAQRPERPDVPPESLFPDGRYAHLWKTYRAQAEVEAGSKSDADRLADVITAYNDRKAAIGSAAVANCVELQLAEKECLLHGPWSSRVTMCREENRAFHRCFTLQSRFLKALGYLAMERGAEEEERIQMHADKLYHDMLAREREVRLAREEGREVPALPPLIQAESTTRALGEDSAWARARRKAAADDPAAAANLLSAYSPARQAEIKKSLEGKDRAEQELELQLIAAETRAQREYAEKIQERIEEERLHRADRRERGKETVGDTIKRLWGWDK